MVLVEIDINTIMVGSMRSRKDAETMRAYRLMIQRLHQAGIVPRKYMLDNEVSENMKAMIRDEFKM